MASRAIKQIEKFTHLVREERKTFPLQAFVDLMAGMLKHPDALCYIHAFIFSRYYLFICSD